QPVGRLNFTGDLRLTLGAGGSLFLDVFQIGGGTGTIEASSFTNTGSFTSVNGLDGVHRDFAPAPGATAIPNLLTIGAFTFDLASILAGSFNAAQCAVPAAAGQTCTPTGTAFNLSNQTATSSVASLAITGTVRNASGTSPFTGLFSAQFSEQNYQQLLAQVTQQGSIETSFSATFVASVVPEPASVALVATGLVAIVGFGLRRRQQG
ncbi:MAG: PEP-CTERM sorting domain-containing protein, partial [Gemmatirosa sp.]